MKHIDLSNLNIEELRAGDEVLLSGDVYTARDAAHKRIVEALDAGRPLPFDLRGAAVYYAGPTPAVGGEIIGSCGPTTSARMDDYTPALLGSGLKVMIGKGLRSDAVVAAMIKNKAVYFAAVGGAAALIKSRVVKNVPVAYEDLGCEAVNRLTFKDLPLLVAIDCKGNSIF